MISSVCDNVNEGVYQTSERERERIPPVWDGLPTATQNHHLAICEKLVTHLHTQEKQSHS